MKKLLILASCVFILSAFSKTDLQNNLSVDIKTNLSKQLNKAFLNQNSKERELLQAVKKGSLRDVKFLVINGSNINIFEIGTRKTPLHYAAQQRYGAIASYLISKGADMEAEDLSGETPLFLSLRNFFKEPAFVLIEQGGNVNFISRYGETPLLVVADSFYDYADIVIALIKKGAKVNYQDPYGKTALHFAVLNKHKAIVKILLENGANINLKDSFGKTPLDYAKTQEIKSLLLEYSTPHITDSK
ncbi:MAG: ankyrin repeat domain-containing protein [Elusimicrobiaceae bacterium]|nr:ankyrin repeat domain-containing protein [Elusimicrobiaceae bacterium]